MSLITGVAEGYYEGVIERNPKLKTTCLYGAMPYGSEQADYFALSNTSLKAYLFNKNGKIQLVYAGAMLPKAYGPLEEIFKSIASDRVAFQDVEFHFIGTGSLANDSESFTIKHIAKKYKLWHSIVFEYPKRIPYIEVLVHLKQADGIFILGSTEPHYTPSKIYQAVLSQKPIWAILHQKSTASKILLDTKAGEVLVFDGVEGLESLYNSVSESFSNFLNLITNYSPEQVDHSKLDVYSAKNVTHKLVQLLNKVS